MGRAWRWLAVAALPALAVVLAAPALDRAESAVARAGLAASAAKVARSGLVAAAVAESGQVLGQAARAGLGAAGLAAAGQLAQSTARAAALAELARTAAAAAAAAAAVALLEPAAGLPRLLALVAGAKVRPRAATPAAQGVAASTTCPCTMSSYESYDLPIYVIRKSTAGFSNLGFGILKWQQAVAIRDSSSAQQASNPGRCPASSSAWPQANAPGSRCTELQKSWGSWVLLNRSSRKFSAVSWL